MAGNESLSPILPEGGLPEGTSQTARILMSCDAKASFPFERLAIPEARRLALRADIQGIQKNVRSGILWFDGQAAQKQEAQPDNNDSKWREMPMKFADHPAG